MSDKFPDNLLLGFSSAAYQIEGGWKDHGKGENIWDRFTHTRPDRIKDKANGDVACDFYNKYKDDVKLIKELGGQLYRFSISWSRILPTGFIDQINMTGVKFYNNLIDELIKNNIEPMITLYHWDLPQPLQDLGGWTNPALSDYFCDYADVAFKFFGDRVKKWITFNEPEVELVNAYNLGIFAPGIKMPGVAEYLGSHTILKAHAKAYHLYDKNYKPKQKGEIGIALGVNWREPRTDTAKDKEAANECLQFLIGWFAHPIFTDKGDYPEIMKKRVAEESRKEGFARSRLPEFEPYWVNFIKGTADFIGVNHYTTLLVTHNDNPDQPPKHLRVNAYPHITSMSPDWERLNEWFAVVPWGLRKSLKWVKDSYKNPKIYLTENGCLDSGTLEDNGRISFFRNYLTELLKAVHEDGCQVGAYTAWSITDNFEWEKGYTEKFGIYHVDFNDPGRKRTPKKSAAYIKDTYKSRILQKDLNKYNS